MSSSLAPRPRGPLVWLDMDQQALDDAYDQSKYANNQLEIIGRRGPASARALKVIAPPERRAYGPTPIEMLDIYRAGNLLGAGSDAKPVAAVADRARDSSDARPDAKPLSPLVARAEKAPIAIFVHGGAWRRGQASDFAYQAEMFVRAGAHHVVPDFVNVEAASGDLMAMVEQLRRAVAWVHDHAASFGGDANRITLIGHSSGAHIAGCVATTDWARLGVPDTVLKGVLLCSGIYDLAPVRRSKRSEYVRFTDAMEHELSAERHIERLRAPLIVAYGTRETPEFQRQARDFAAAVKAAGKPVELIVAENYNHFEIGETLANPYGILGRAALTMMGLASGQPGLHQRAR
jgi:arylformamidase